jgi:hypothetical protein
MSLHHQRVSEKYVFDVAKTDELIDRLEAVFKRRREFTDKVLGIVDNLIIDVKQSRCARVRKDISSTKGS